MSELISLETALNLPVMIFIAHRVWVLSVVVPRMEDRILDHERRITRLEAEEE